MANGRLKTINMYGLVATGKLKKLDIFMWMVSGLKAQTDGVGLKDIGNKSH